MTREPDANDPNQANSRRRPQGRTGRNGDAPPAAVWQAPREPEAMPLARVGRVFKLVAPEGLFQAPVLTDEAQQLFGQVPAELPIDEKAIRRSSGLDDGQALAAVTELAQRQFDSEPLRACQRSWAEAGLRALQTLTYGELELRERWVDSRRHASHQERVTVGNPQLWKLSSAPDLVQMVFWLAIFCLAVFSEFRNGVYLVTTGMEDFRHDWFGAACFCASFLIGGFVVAKFCQQGLNGASQQRFNSRLKWAAVPLVIGGMALFAWKTGCMQDFNAFDGSTGPPFWMMTLSSILLLVLIAMLVPRFVSTLVSRQWPYEVCESVEFLAADKRLKSTNNQLAPVHQFEEQLRRMLGSLDEERAYFVCQAVAKLREFQAEMEASGARLRLANLRGDARERVAG